MRTIKLAVFTFLFLSFFLPSAYSEEVKLSPRSIQKLKELKELVSDTEELQKLANTLLVASAFTVLLDKPDPTSIYQISTTDWGLISTAAQGLAINTRADLRTYCALEALAQDSSPPDREFWRHMADSFKEVPPQPSITGKWIGKCVADYPALGMMGVVSTLEFTLSKTGSSFTCQLQSPVGYSCIDVKFDEKSGDVGFKAQYKSDPPKLQWAGRVASDRKSMSLQSTSIPPKNPPKTSPCSVGR